MHASNKVTVVSFDLADSPYTAHGARWIQSHFPGRLQLVVGDSAQTVPLFARLSPDFRCNVILIDGAHTYEGAQADLRHFRALATESYHVLVMDDYEGMARRPDMP